MRVSKTLPRLSLTGFGYSAIILGLVVLVMAVNYSNNLLFTGVYFWFSLLLTSGIRGWMQFSRLADGQWHYGELFAGNQTELLLKIDGDGFDGLLFIKGESDCVWRPEIENCGVQTLQPPSLLAIEILGLWRYRKATPALRELYVYAQPKAHLSLQTHLQQASLSSAEVDEISYLRPWQLGDSFRAVDWKTTARIDSGQEAQWVCREYGGEQSSQLCHLHWQQLDTLNEKQRRETLTAWLLELFHQNIAWQLSLPSQTFAASNSYRHRVNCLRALAGRTL